MSVQQSPRKQIFTAGGTLAEFFVVEIACTYDSTTADDVCTHVYSSTDSAHYCAPRFRTHMHKTTSSRAHPTRPFLSDPRPGRGYSVHLRALLDIPPLFCAEPPACSRTASEIRASLLHTVNIIPPSTQTNINQTPPKLTGST